ncbi:MAG: HAD family hydrolase [Candidatus Woesearchaeota archaeon]
MIKAIIFDYDGVIVDSFSNVHKIYLVICKELGKTCPDNLSEFKNIYGENSNECYANLGISEDEKVPADRIYKREIVKHFPELFPEIKTVLHALSKEYILFLVSSSYIEEVSGKLQHHGLDSCFKEVLAKIHDGGHHGKVDSIKYLLKKYDLEANDVLLIGDRNIDFNEGKAAGLEKILLVSYGWGFNIKTIPSYDVQEQINTPVEILSIIKKF